MTLQTAIFGVARGKSALRAPGSCRRATGTWVMTPVATGRPEPAAAAGAAAAVMVP